MNKVSTYIIISICIIIGLAGCELDTQNYPPEPSITLKEVDYYWQYNYLTEGWVKICNIHFYAIDGDGDVGVFKGDSGVNCYMDRYLFRNREFVIDSSYNYTIPAPDDLGQDKTYKADIYIVVENSYVYFDTVYYRFYIVDRAQHKSNTLITDTMIYGPNPYLSR